MSNTVEQKRLAEKEANWKQWGPYLSERAWGTVREDYSAGGNAWEYFPHDHARSRAYRWNEDGLAGISDDKQYLCFGLGLWNGNDPILKERLFGLTGPEGNHGEDVKEVYFYLDSTPTHSYMQMLYKYPQAAFPYGDLVAENGRRSADDPEYELLDTGVFNDNRYFDVFVTYAKQSSDDILIEIRVENRGDAAAPITLLPQLWFRNVWSWGYTDGPMKDVPYKPCLHQVDAPYGQSHIQADHPTLGIYHLHAEDASDVLFTDNDTNTDRIFSYDTTDPYTKDAFHRYIINGEQGAVNRDQEGTKCAAVYNRTVLANGSITIKLRLTADGSAEPFTQFDSIVAKRKAECDAFYAALRNENATDEQTHIQRQALAGMLWSKQLYYYDIQQWLHGDPNRPESEARDKTGRNNDWEHLVNFDIISMPDKWEYPWYATWDLAFHCLPLALVDMQFAKDQLLLTTREWYMHPNGQLPAYEWAFGDVNPPVQAWAAWKVYLMEEEGQRDRPFLERMLHKLLLNFTWWVNRKDADDNNIFQGGFLGLDNISLFDRSAELPTGGHIDQSDGTAWVGAYSLQLMRMAIELAAENPVYEDIASKLFEHFLYIANAMTDAGHGEVSLWNDEDGFFYDALHLPNGESSQLKVRSLVGLLPLFATEVLPHALIDTMPNFHARMDWLMKHRPHLAAHVLCTYDDEGEEELNIASLLRPDRLRRVLSKMLDESEFLSPYGIRSVSKYHKDRPFELHINGETYGVPYWPAESKNNLFGGNSNWRGPVWFPINYLIIDSLNELYAYYGDDFTVAYPAGTGNQLTLAQVADMLSRRLIRLFERQEDGKRPIYGDSNTFNYDEHWRDHILFHEYFHGDNGAGLGASHQTGWTGLVATLIDRL